MFLHPFGHDLKIMGLFVFLNPYWFIGGSYGTRAKDNVTIDMWITHDNLIGSGHDFNGLNPCWINDMSTKTNK
jgi:hypothetical protein